MKGDEIAALGLFTLRDERRRGVISSRAARLHQTGDTQEDQIWVEYNGLLAQPSDASDALCCAVDALLDADLADEVHLSMLPESLSTCLQALPWPAQRVAETRGYQHDLFAARQAGKPVAAMLSRNTRHQLNRSQRLYREQFGDAALEVAACSEQAVAMFHEAGEWHRRRWPDSGFNNPAFVAFHERYIKRGFDHGNVMLCRVAFGERVLGVFYYLCSGRHAYFYLQGVRSESNGKLKPGLTGHGLLMQYCLEKGFDVYDFMGGESQYKRQLSNRQTGFVILRLHNAATRFRLEDRGRAIKQRLSGA